MRLLDAPTFEDQDRRVLVGPEVELSDDTCLVQLPRPARLRLEVRGELFGGGAGRLPFQGKDLHGCTLIPDDLRPGE